MKVMFYSEAPYLGGAEVALSEIIAALPDSYEVVVAGSNPEVLERLSAGRPSAERLPLAAIGGRKDIGAMLAHARAFRKAKPDLIHFHLGIVSAAQWAIFVATAKGRYRTVVLENSPVEAWSSSSETLKKFTSRRLSAHVAVATGTARRIEEMVGLKKGSVGVLRLGVPDVAQRPREQRDATTVVSIARHQHVKGVDVLLRAMALLPEHVRLVQIGDGEDTAELTALRDELGLGGRAELQGPSWDERPANELSKYGIFVLSSRNEGIPVTVMEAMLAGNAIVATDVGSVSEALRHEHNALLVAPDDPAALAGAIGRLLDDEGLRRRLGEQARRDGLENFVIDAVAARFDHLYRSVMAGEGMPADLK